MPGVNENFPDLPDDASEIIEDTLNREAQRRKALEIALEGFKEAKTEEERILLATRIKQFSDILEEYRNMYPEILRDIDE